MGEGQDVQSLLCRVDERLCALPLAHVEEIMRPLPVQSLPGAPEGVRGVCTIRGRPTPLVDLGALLGAPLASPGRFVSVKAGDRRVALAVAEVIGVIRVAESARHALPPLLGAAAAEVIAAIGLLDAAVLLVLREWRLMDEALWHAVATLDIAR